MTNQDRELMQQALRWADQHGEAVYSGGGWDAVNGMNEWAQALRSRLAQPEQEPVAYYHPHKGFYWAKPTRISAPTAVDVKPLPLYTAPPQPEQEPVSIRAVAKQAGINLPETYISTMDDAIAAGDSVLMDEQGETHDQRR